MSEARMLPGRWQMPPPRVVMLFAQERALRGSPLGLRALAMVGAREESMP